MGFKGLREGGFPERGTGARSRACQAGVRVVGFECGHECGDHGQAVFSSARVKQIGNAALKGWVIGQIACARAAGHHGNGVLRVDHVHDLGFGLGGFAARDKLGEAFGKPRIQHGGVRAQRGLVVNVNHLMLEQLFVEIEAVGQIAFV